MSFLALRRRIAFIRRATWLYKVFIMSPRRRISGQNRVTEDRKLQLRTEPISFQQTLSGPSALCSDVWTLTSNQRGNPFIFSALLQCVLNEPICPRNIVNYFYGHMGIANVRNINVQRASVSILISYVRQETKFNPSSFIKRFRVSQEPHTFGK